MNKPVVKFPAKALSTKCSSVTEVNDSVKTLIKDMFETMNANNGVGLAANQVGESLRILVCQVPDTRESPAEWNNKPLALINPEITSRSITKSSYKEGCLSFSDLYEFIERPMSITVSYTDENGESKTLEADGLLATCIQHEIDHLDGKTFIDRMSRLKKYMAIKKLKKNWKL